MAKNKIYDQRLNAEDREAAEIGSKICWNKFTRFMDKFLEIIFIITLLALSVWGIVRQFIHDRKFNFQLTLISFYLFMFSSLIFLSFINNITVLTYFGFMRGRFSKSFFFLFCSCILLPGDSSAGGILDDVAWSYVLSLTLMVGSIL